MSDTILQEIQPPQSRSFLNGGTVPPSRDQLDADYDYMTRKGRQYYRLLNDAAHQSSSTPMRPRPEESYVYDTGTISRPFPGYKRLQEHNPPSVLRYVDVRNIGTTKHDLSIYSKFDTTVGSMMIWEVDKRRDRGREEKQLWLSEVYWWSWQIATNEDHVQSHNLNSIVLWSLVNDLSKEAIWKAERHASHREVKPDKRGYRAYSPQDARFYAILGSPVGSSALRMRVNHKEELKHPTVDMVTVLKVEDDHDLEEFERSRGVVMISLARTGGQDSG